MTKSYEDLIEQMARAMHEIEHGKGSWEDYDCWTTDTDVRHEEYRNRAEAAFLALVTYTETASTAGVTRRALEQVHGQNPQRQYSVAEVKQIVYPLVIAIDEQGPENTDPEYLKDAQSDLSVWLEERFTHRAAATSSSTC